MKQKTKYINDGHPIYFTYARNEDKDGRRHISDCVDDLRKRLDKENILYLIDTEDITIGDSITKFEQKIGKADFVIIVFSDKYFRSKHCMFEYVNIKKNIKNKKIYCIKADGCDLSDKSYLDDLDNYWRDVQKEYHKIKDKNIRKPSKIETAAFKNDFYLSELTNLYDFFADTNYQKVETLIQDDYQNFITALKSDLSSAHKPIVFNFFNLKISIVLMCCLVFAFIIINILQQSSYELQDPFPMDTCSPFDTPDADTDVVTDNNPNSVQYSNFFLLITFICICLTIVIIIIKKILHRDSSPNHKHTQHRIDNTNNKT